MRFTCYGGGTASIDFMMPEGSGVHHFALIMQPTSGQQLEWRKYTSETSYTVLWRK